jgi:L-ascorbate metabolism protein UlaG (beta-lactamase superfamily)
VGGQLQSGTGKPAVATAIAALLAACTSCACGDAPVGKRLRFDEYYAAHTLKDEARPVPRIVEKGVKVTYLGATTLLFDDGETEILVDGFVSRHKLLTTAFRGLDSKAKVVRDVVLRGEMERLAAVFVTHSHYDHALDLAEIIQGAEARKKESNVQAANGVNDCPDPQRVTLFGSESTLRIGEGRSLLKCQRKLLRPGEPRQAGRFTVVAFPSKHSPPIPGVNDDLGQVIQKPLCAGVHARAYKEGGSYDLLITHEERITHDQHTILIKAGADYVEDMLENVRAEVLFLPVGRLGKQCRKFQDTLFEQSVGFVDPRLVIATHWDNFFEDLDDDMQPPPRWIDDVPAALNFLRERVKDRDIRLGLMQGFESIMLFDGRLP